MHQRTASTLTVIQLQPTILPSHVLLMGVQPEACHAVCRPNADLTHRDLQLQLLQALLQGQPSPSRGLNGSPLNPLPFSGMAPARVGVMTGRGPMTGLLLDDNPGLSANSAQLLQALFKLELEGQMPKVGHIACYQPDTMQLLQVLQYFSPVVVTAQADAYHITVRSCFDSTARR